MLRCLIAPTPPASGTLRMNCQRIYRVLITWAVMAITGCGGCGEQPREEHAEPPVQQAPKMERLDIPLEPQPLLVNPRLMKLAGEVDGENRYRQAVMVTVLSGGEGVRSCSGTAISRHVVLTAGHCVCTKRQLAPTESGAQAFVDASACFDEAEVTTLVYTSRPEPGWTLWDSQGTSHGGRVQPHPALRIVLDEEGRVSASRADLALIFLSRPLGFPGLPLGDEDVRVGESITIVGYGYDEDADVSGSERRFNTNKVTRLMTPEDERVLIQQPGDHRYRQDSGGPCLRQGVKGPSLVGISSRWLGEGAAFTSIHGYKDWLREAIRRAETGAPLQR